ncbi:hypothetical protein BC940DRAFT_301908 [Gongronella butleri]|nr:hypothetical protein BC940DRAFT_301908 [Gongronella butleri]
MCLFLFPSLRLSLFFTLSPQAPPLFELKINSLCEKKKSIVLQAWQIKCARRHAIEAQLGAQQAIDRYHFFFKRVLIKRASRQKPPLFHLKR